jgi:HD superfamily phosphohydrolase
MLHSDLGYDEPGKHRYRKLIRLAALLHDVGHGPFSHAAEELTPPNGLKNSPYQHEDYSTAVIRQEFRDVIETHNGNNNFNFRVEEIAGLIEGGAAAGRAALWRDLISGQLDADRMDYLLRDSYHAGVEYGRYDWRRIVATVQLVPDIETETPRIGVSGGGRHAAEGLIIARYMMFNQVYFHKTRVILDHHLQGAVRGMLPGGLFPAPIKDGIKEYLKWDDWQVLGRLANGEGGDDGRRLIERDFFREVWETPEFPNHDDEAQLTAAQAALGKMLAARCEAGKSWYKVGPSDLLIAEGPGGKTKPLSLSSTIVAKMIPSKRIRLYVRKEDRKAAIAKLGDI